MQSAVVSVETRQPVLESVFIASLEWLVQYSGPDTVGPAIRTKINDKLNHTISDFYVWSM